MLIKANANHLDILFRWVRYSSKFNLSEVLKNHSIHNIAIYGGGALGVALYENLVASLNIKYIIDKNPDLSFPYDVQTILPAETEFLNELDAVIITVDFYNVEEKLRPYVKCISLDNLIINVDEYTLFEKACQHISESKATLLLADLTAPLRYINNPSSFEKIAKLMGWDWPALIGNDIVNNYYSDCNYTSEQIESLFSEKYWNPIKIHEQPVFGDVTSELHNVVNNCRFTTDVPDKYDNTIHFFGNCISAGWAAEDKNTIESCLQRLLNKSPIADKTFRIVNRSIPQFGKASSSFLQILNTTFQAGDYIILITKNIYKYKYYYDESEFVKYTNLHSAFDRPHEYEEVFFDGYHMNHKGYKLIADKLYEMLKALASDVFGNANTSVVPLKVMKKHKQLPLRKIPEIAENKDLNSYLDFLRAERISSMGVMGSVVMNCNPFTFGHRFLIEESRKNCDFLYIFVVEEDKSFFPFSERKQCVEEGVADIKNVKVLPSGKYIISSLTFPEYFIKEQLETAIDASLDVEMFAKNIAPILNIKKRFVGQEPLCPITRQYNKAMSEILPKYGIELIIFERKEINSVPISASKVRELLNQKNFAELIKFVPECTLKYLEAYNKRH